MSSVSLLCNKAPFRIYFLIIDVITSNKMVCFNIKVGVVGMYVYS